MVRVLRFPGIKICEQCERAKRSGFTVAKCRRRHLVFCTRKIHSRRPTVFCPRDGNSLYHTPRLLRRILRVASVQSLYKAAIYSGRKDLVSGGSGVFDSDLSVFREPGLQWKIKGLDPHVVVGPMVGACPTGDRLYKGGLLDTPKCRFCASCDKEDIRHLTGECIGIISLLGHPGRLFPEHPNFLSHGIREVPQFLLDSWANTDIPTVSPPAAFQCEAVRVWGDGSVYNGDHFFTKTLGFALINHDGSTICTKGWQDPFGCSYKAELYALLHCVQIFQGYIEFTTDCAALLRVWQVVQSSNILEDNLAYRDEWMKIKLLANNDGQSRLSIFWIKAHQVDSDYCLMTESQRNNRLADQVASKSAREASPVASHVVESWRHFTRLHWMIWLSKLTKLISDKKREQAVPVEQHTPDAEPSASAGQQVDEQFRNRFCKWDWGIDSAAYEWRMQVQQCNPPAKWNHSVDMWNKTVLFLGGIKWRTGESSVSIYTLAFLFWCRCGFTPPTLIKGTEGNFHLLVQWLRQILKDLKKLGIATFPGDVTFCVRSTMHTSQYFPCGTFKGGRVYMTHEERTLFARFVAALPEARGPRLGQYNFIHCFS